MKHSEVTEACIWAYISKKADATVNKKVEKWINSIHYNEDLFNEIAEIYKFTEQNSLINDLDITIAKQQVFKSIESNKNRRNPWRKFLKYAAVFVFFLASFLYTYLQTSVNSIHIQTSYNEKKQVNLPDGSIVWLNASSEISYHKKTPRTIYLRGEAFFKVAKDKTHPFTVETPDQLKVKALGTSFNIKSYVKNKFTETILLTGKVEVSSENYFKEKIIMLPKDKIRIIKENGNIIESTIKNKNQIGWKEGFILFNNKSFKEIANDLKIQNNINISFENHEIENSKFTASFKEGTSINKILELLKKTKDFNFQYKTSTNTWTIQ